MINAILKTVQNLGDHGREVSIALDIKSDMTIKELCNLHLLSEFNESTVPYNVIELRFTKK